MARKIRDSDRRLGSDSRRDRRQDSNLAEDGRTLSDDIRLDEFRRANVNNVLPNLPKIKGYHVIWLTTKHPSDTIASRMRMGYELIRPAEIPEYKSMSMKTGDYGNVIQCNEMIAAKIPLHLYEMYMREAHHDAPLQEEQKLEEQIQSMQDQLISSAKRGKKSVKIEREEGSDDLVKDRPAPRFGKAYGER
jgi:hypothetical protein